MDHDEAWRQALRLAIDPPGGVSVDTLRELVRDDAAADWDISTTATHLGVNPPYPGLRRARRPHPGRPGRRWPRRHDPPAVRRLVFLTRLRTSGMSISDLRHYVDLAEAGQDTVPERLDLLLEHRDTLRSQIA